MNLQAQQVEKYDVFVFKLYEGNISKKGSNGLIGRLTLAQSVSICDQLFEGLIQLENSKSCHNDLKPENILYNCDQNGNIEIAISDFGQAGRTGGTPGWTWPKFLAKREPGKSDLYSVALLVLYVMCDEREVFYRVRNNYVDNFGQLWLTAIQNDSFFKLIIYMINLKVTPTEAKDWWNQISGQVQIITKDYLCRTFGVDRSFLEVQDGIDRFNLLDATVLDRLFNIFTKTKNE